MTWKIILSENTKKELSTLQLHGGNRRKSRTITTG
jgi:hypothetical protein